MREVARLSGAEVHGLNNNDYQIEKGRTYNVRDGLDGQCTFVKGDFMKMPFEDAQYDAAYEIEATCHAPDRVGCYSEIFRVLKPGGVFAGYEWCLTDAYDPNNSEHRRIKKGIEVGNGLPDLLPTTDVDSSLRAAGFELLTSSDHAETADPSTPWYQPLVGEALSVTALRRSNAGRALTHGMVSVLERLRLAPEGSVAVSQMLNDAADALIEGGQMGIFTPAWFFLAKKPA